MAGINLKKVFFFLLYKRLYKSYIKDLKLETFNVNLFEIIIEITNIKKYLASILITKMQ